MELFGGGLSKAEKERDQNTSILELYLDPPEENITLQEFESIAKTRQRILQEVSNLKEKHDRGDIDDDQHKVMMREKTKDLTISTSESGKEKDKGKIRHDLIGHYILRLAYCESEETRRWFLSQEVDLLRYRLLLAKRYEVDSFFERYKEYFPFEKTRLTTLKPNLQNNIINFYKLQENDAICYKIYFTELLDLVQKRAVIIDKGFVYICAANTQMLISLICNKFRAILSHDLTLTRHHVWRAKDDERINPIIKNIRSKYLGDDFTNLSTKIEQISIKEIDTVSKESFPPCMRHLHESLRSNHHLRHFGRLQYNLFLKSIGISMEQSLAFWREEFTKIMDHEKVSLLLICMCILYST
jgi:DNA primase large subunit